MEGLVAFFPEPIIVLAHGLPHHNNHNNHNTNNNNDDGCRSSGSDDDDDGGGFIGNYVSPTPNTASVAAPVSSVYYDEEGKAQQLHKSKYYEDGVMLKDDDDDGAGGDDEDSFALVNNSTSQRASSVPVMAYAFDVSCADNNPVDDLPDEQVKQLTHFAYSGGIDGNGDDDDDDDDDDHEVEDEVKQKEASQDHAVQELAQYSGEASVPHYAYTSTCGSRNPQGYGAYVFDDSELAPRDLDDEQKEKEDDVRESGEGEKGGERGYVDVGIQPKSLRSRISPYASGFEFYEDDDLEKEEPTTDTKEDNQVKDSKKEEQQHQQQHHHNQQQQQQLEQEEDDDWSNSDDDIQLPIQQQTSAGVMNWNEEFQRLFESSSTAFSSSIAKQQQQQQESPSHTSNHSVYSIHQWKEDVALLFKIYDLSLRFAQTAERIGTQIIREMHFPVSKRLYPPATSIAGLAGGEKYIHENVFFKFSFDLHGYYGGDEYAMKAAGLELKGLKSYFDFILATNTTELHVPLMALIDYMGYRLIAVSVLPVNNSTLKYGSADAGVTARADDKQVNRLMKKAGKYIGLKAHVVGQQVKQQIYGPCDIEGHKGRDGRCYVLDTARVFPPHPPSRSFNAIFIGRNPASKAKGQVCCWEIHHQSTSWTDKESEIKSKLDTENISKLNVPTIGGELYCDSDIQDVALLAVRNDAASLLMGTPIYGDVVFVPGGVQGKRLYHCFRSEFVKSYAERVGPLSSDAYTGFGKDRWKEHNNDVRAAELYLVSTIAPKFVDDLISMRYMPTDGQQLTSLMHKDGLNIYYLGLLFKLVVDKMNKVTDQEGVNKPKQVGSMLVSEMFVRCVKSILRGVMRRFSAAGETAVKREIVSNLNYIFGQGHLSRYYHDLVLYVLIITKFDIQPHEMALVKELALNTDSARNWLLRGATFALRIIVREHKYDYTSQTPFQISDIISINPRVTELHDIKQLTIKAQQLVQIKEDHWVAKASTQESSKAYKANDQKSKLSSFNDRVKQRKRWQWTLKAWEFMHKPIKRVFGANSLFALCNTLRLSSIKHDLMNDISFDAATKETKARTEKKRKQQLRQQQQQAKIIRAALRSRVDGWPLEVVMSSLYRLGVIAESTHDLPVAEQQYHKALHIADMYLGGYLEPGEGHPLVLLLMNRLGLVLYKQERYEEMRHLGTYFAPLYFKYGPLSTTPETQRIWGSHTPVLLGFLPPHALNKQIETDEFQCCISAMHIIGHYARTKPEQELCDSRYEWFTSVVHQFEHMSYEANMMSAPVVAPKLQTEMPYTAKYDPLPDSTYSKSDFTLHLDKYDVQLGETIKVLCVCKTHAPLQAYNLFAVAIGHDHHQPFSNRATVAQSYAKNDPVWWHTFSSNVETVELDTSKFQLGGRPTMYVLFWTSSSSEVKFWHLFSVRPCGPSTRLLCYNPKDEPWTRTLPFPSQNIVTSMASRVYNDHTIESALAVTAKGNMYGWRSTSAANDDTFWPANSDAITSSPSCPVLFRGKRWLKVVVGHRSLKRSHCAAISDKGELFTWGDNKYGQLGLGHTSKTLMPALVSSLEDRTVVDVAVGNRFTVMLTKAGEAYYAGKSQGLEQTFVPKLLKVFQGERVVQVCAGSTMALALTDTGLVYMWGIMKRYRDQEERVPAPLECLFPYFIIDIKAGQYMFAALSDKGEVLTWGTSRHGVHGNGAYCNALGITPIKRPYSVKAVRYLAIPEVAVVQLPSPAARIAIGSEVGCCLTTDGKLWHWGAGVLLPQRMRFVENADLERHIQGIYCGQRTIYVSLSSEAQPPSLKLPRPKAALKEKRKRWFETFVWTIDCMPERLEHTPTYLHVTLHKPPFCQPTHNWGDYLSLCPAGTPDSIRKPIVWKHIFSPTAEFHTDNLGRRILSTDAATITLNQLPRGAYELVYYYDVPIRVLARCPLIIKTSADLLREVREGKRPPLIDVNMPSTTTIYDKCKMLVHISPVLDLCNIWAFNCSNPEHPFDPEDYPQEPPPDVKCVTGATGKAGIQKMKCTFVAEGQFKLAFYADPHLSPKFFLGVTHDITVTGLTQTWAQPQLQQQQQQQQQQPQAVATQQQAAVPLSMDAYWASQQVQPTDITFTVTPQLTKPFTPITITWDFDDNKTMPTCHFFGLCPVTDPTHTQLQGAVMITQKKGAGVIVAPAVGVYSVRYLVASATGMTAVGATPVVNVMNLPF
eukprot:TRINITY_DN795_c0_g1_i9.p1 TRINITY_DN795_c0_g1~~TRINITY_DN795_c0_g1_i9.p1  ORF type:complete len:2194 (+),score=429.59 TRINITY_DN795_c0_g1_i9:34-6615(+)